MKSYLHLTSRPYPHPAADSKQWSVQRSLDKDTLKEMSGVFRTTSGLCDINYKDDGENNTWSSDSSLGSFFRKSLSLDDSSPKTVLNRTECEIFALKAKDLNIIIPTAATRVRQARQHC